MKKEIEEFIKRYKEDKLLYEAWGNFVLTEIESGKLNIKYKIPPKVRIKDSDSLVAKAFFRGKNYKHPYENITDKVGMRFVVLLTSEIKKIDDFIITNKNWEYSKDRDFEKEREEEPLSFDYQSMHYIVISKYDINYDNITIPKGIECEIQIRTLLQHAYSELSHDRVYKPRFDSSAKVKRIIAKSMALLEATDEYFEEVDKQMKDITVFKILDHLTENYSKIISSHKQINNKTNLMILEAFSENLDVYSQELNEYIINNIKSLNALIVNYNSETFLNSQPIIVFIYFMIDKHKSVIQEKWPLLQSDLQVYFNQLGISTNSYS
jgi:ppGpp synthetase/RelA/SpoT-type nucleotidyltranferase